MAPTRRATAPQRRRPPVAGSRPVRSTTRSAGEREVAPPAESGAGPAEVAQVRPRTPRPPLARWLIALAVAATLLAGFFLVQGWRTANSDVARNQALVNGPGTAEVAGQVAEALRRVFSYRHDDTASTEAAASEVLVDAARAQYDALFAQVREQAPQQKLVLSTKAVSTGVRELSAERAVLLVFLDQTATRGDNNQTSASAAQLGVTARKVGEKWLITELQPR
ncbi:MULTISPECIES: hypothetical protein [unclassified Crossiella]|uniref:hypothetical protein n=1 Tax=unclassified Crossiella TaxID=2620835 RepID=UPI001FFE610F|nr:MULTISPECIES: hypothetical protein [unclassified Crossiella]MCK2239902.1 hypothetical protein [Crossiella sp. S99.2]MCK2252610.1 hypothetical protein [Crossiella sp. S99.1]